VGNLALEARVSKNGWSICRVVTEGMLMHKPCVHLWLYNHPFHGISDQVNFVVRVLRQNGYTVSVGRRPHRASLNIVIENFSPKDRVILVEYCRLFRKRVGVIMTEHIDFDRGQILFHGIPLDYTNDYMHPATIRARVRHLIECIPYVRCFFTLGDLPELRNIRAMFPGIDVRTIPFPKIDKLESEQFRKGASSAVVDLVFTGGLTKHRKEVLARLERKNFSVMYPQAFVSRRRRNIMNQAAKVILNIQQRSSWKWLSPMRIIAGLQIGRATISLGTSDVSRIASCCTQLDITSPDWIGIMQQLVATWKSLYFRDAENYSIMAKNFEQEYPFPHDLFKCWSITDRVR